MLHDCGLNFNEHVQSKINKFYKIIGLIKKLSIHLPREALLRIYLIDLNWTMAISFLINLIMNHSKLELKAFNIRHV